MIEDQTLRTVLLPLREWKRIHRAFARLAPRWRPKDESLRRGIVSGLDSCIRETDNPAPLAIDRSERAWGRLLLAAECWKINVWRVAHQLDSMPPQQNLLSSRVASDSPAGSQQLALSFPELN